MHTGGLTQSWRLSAGLDACFRSTKEKRTLAASAKQGRNRADPQNKWFWQLLGMSPQTHPLGPAGHKQRAPHSCPSGHGRTPREPGTVSAAAPHWVPKTVVKRRGLATCCSKDSKEARLVESKGCRISERADWQGGQTPIQRLTPHPRQSVGKSFYRCKEGAACRNNTDRSDSHPEVGRVVV